MTELFPVKAIARWLLSSLLLPLLVGCNGRSLTEVRADQTPAHDYAMYEGSNGAFLVDKITGKVWELDSKQNAFLEVPVTSKITSFIYGPDGKLIEETGAPPEGSRKTNTAGDKLVYHNGKWVLDNDPLRIR